MAIQDLSNMKFATQFNGGAVTLSQCLPEDNPAVLPDLSFTVQEICNKFTLQRVILESKNAEVNYLLDSSSNDFDSVPTNVPQGYDLVDARADALRVTNARLAYIDKLRRSKKSPEAAPQATQTEASPKTE